MVHMSPHTRVPESAMLRWALAVGPVPVARVREFPDQASAPDEVKMLGRMYGTHTKLVWVKCAYNNSFVPIVCVLSKDDEHTWLPFPSLETLQRHQQTDTQLVRVLRALPLVGGTSRVVAHPDDFKKDDASSSNTANEAAVHGRFHTDKERMRNRFTLQHTPHGLVSADHHGGVAETQLGCVVMSDVHGVHGDKHTEVLMAKGTVWFQQPREHERLCVLNRDNVLVEHVIVASDATKERHVGVCRQTFVVEEMHGETRTLRVRTGRDMFSATGPSHNEDAGLAEEAIRKVYRLTRDEPLADEKVCPAHEQRLLDLTASLGCNVAEIVWRWRRSRCRDRDVLLKTICDAAHLHALRTVNLAACVWWPREDLVVMTKDEDVSDELRCTEINTVVRYELLKWDDMAAAAVVHVDSSEQPYAQYMVFDDRVWLWCVPLGKYFSLHVVPREEYDQMTESEPLPMDTTHASAVPGGVFSCTVSLKSLLPKMLPFTASVTGTDGTTHCLMRHRATVSSAPLHCVREGQWSWGLTCQGEVPEALFTDEYKVPKHKVAALVNRASFFRAVCLLTAGDVQRLAHVLHDNAPHLSTGVRFPNTHDDVKISNQTTFWAWSNSRVVSSSRRFCVVCAHVLGVGNHSSDMIGTRLIDAVVAKRPTFLHHQEIHTITTRNGHVCAVKKHSNGQEVEVWRDPVSQSSGCQLCAARREKDSQLHLTPPYFEHDAPGGSIAETIMSLILKLCLHSQHAEVSPTCVVASSVLLSVLTTFLTTDAPWITDEFLEHLVNNVLFPEDVMRAVYTARVGTAPRKQDVGRGFHLEQRQIMCLPAMLLLTQACVAATLHAYVGRDGHRIVGRDGCVAHNMARAAMQSAFNTVVVGPNLLTALYKTSNFLGQYLQDVTPTHTLLRVAQITKRHVWSILCDDEVLRARLLYHMLYLNCMGSCVLFNSLAPTVTSCEGGLRVCGMTYAYLHENVFGPLVVYAANHDITEATTGNDDGPLLHRRVENQPVVSVSKTPCRFLTKPNDGSETKGESAHYCDVPKPHATSRVWVGSGCACVVTDGRVSHDEWCPLCNEPLLSCEHHVCFSDEVGCAKCGRVVRRVGSPVFAHTREERLMRVECAPSRRPAESHVELDDVSHYVVTGKLSCDLDASSNAQFGLPAALTTPPTEHDVPDLLSRVACNAMEAATYRCRDMPYVRKNHTMLLVHQIMSKAVVLGNTTVFGLLCWVRWCAAFCSGSEVPYEHMRGGCDRLYPEDENSCERARCMLERVRADDDEGWVNLFLCAFGDPDEIRVATDVMLAAQRACVLHPELAARDAAMLRANVLQVSRWVTTVVEGCVFESMFCERALVVQDTVGARTNRWAIHANTYHVRVLAELQDFAERNSVLNTTGVVGTASLEFVRFATWLICCMIDKRYCAGGQPDTSPLLSLAMEHLQFAITPCVLCGTGRVCLTTGSCLKCKCVAHTFVVPFGASDTVIKLLPGQPVEMATMDVLPGRVTCSGGHCQFVDGVLRALITERWQDDDVLLRDVLACQAANAANLSRVQMDECAVVQHECSSWRTGSVCDNRLRERLMCTNSSSLWHVAHDCRGFLVPQHQLAVSKSHDPRGATSSSVQYSENICSVPLLREMVGVLLFFNRDVVFRLDGAPEQWRATLVRDGGVFYERLSAAADRVTKSLHDTIRARLEQSTATVDTSVLHLTRDCVGMCLREEARAMYEQYVDFVEKVIVEYQQHGDTDTKYVFFHCDTFELKLGTRRSFLMNVVRLGHVCVSATNSTVAVRTGWLRRVQRVSLASLRADLYSTAAHGTREDMYFVRIALKDAYLTAPNIEASVRSGRFLFTGVPDHLLNRAFVLLDSAKITPVSELFALCGNSKRLKTL